MLFRHPRLAFIAAALLATGIAVAFACRPTTVTSPAPTTTPTASPQTTGPGIPAATLKDIDWKNPLVLDELRKHFNGGEIEPKRVAYADLTRDGKEDALVIVESGGTAGDLGAAVYTIENGRAVVTAWIDRGGQIELRLPNAGPNSALVVVKQGIYAP
ncbi:MAG: hypothetical protein EPO65_05245, partial [Dehalococcoidia bacterium]